MRWKMFAAGLTALAFASAALGQDRRLEIRIIDGQLAAQGYIAGPAPMDDGAGLVRPYINSMHDHWDNGPSREASTGLPGFDLLDPTGLEGHELTITLTGASKWVAPPDMPGPEVVPSLTALSPAEEIFVTRLGVEHSTASPGSFTLLGEVASGAQSGLDLAYTIGVTPTDTIYVLKFTLSTDAPGILDSDTVHILLSPDGLNKIERLHYASLHLEASLGTPIPAPGAGLLAGVGLLALRRRR